MGQITEKAKLNNIKQLAKEISIEQRLGQLKSGCEWLAFTFQAQEIQKEDYAKWFNKFVEFSEKKLKEAYSRMKIDTHNWAKGTENEIDYLMSYLAEGEILDFGCGIGRHAIELAQRGRKVTGIDFAQPHIEKAKKLTSDLNLENMCEFHVRDARTVDLGKQFPNAICLYDVIGSFPKEEDNRKIILNLYRHLIPGGILILSVMNMELTEYLIPAEQKKSLKNNPDLLLNLPPSDIMQSSGDIFNPDYLLIDTDSGLVFRKEQFERDNVLSAEYVIRDKRYQLDEISTLLQDCGFIIEDKRYVRAGHFDESLKPTDLHAKEICIIAKKRD